MKVSEAIRLLRSIPRAEREGMDVTLTISNRSGRGNSGVYDRIRKVLEQYPGITLKNLAARLQHPPDNVSTILTYMVKKGEVRRTGVAGGRGREGYRYWRGLNG